MSSIRSKAASLIARTTVKPVLAAYGTVTDLPIPWPYALVTMTAECVVTPSKRTVSSIEMIEGATVHVTTPEVHDTDSCILYIHGGALLMLSPKSHRRLISHVAYHSGCEVFAPSYPMAHQVSIPEIVKHLVPVYRELSERYSRVAIAGDSAGGYLSLALLAAARRSGLPDPAALVLISPVADLDTRRALADFDGSDPIFPRSVLKTMARVARKTGTHKKFLGLDMIALESKPLPPTLLNYAEGELLSADALHLKDRFPEIELLPGKGMDLHVYPALGNFVPEAQHALRRIGEFIRRQVIAPKPVAELVDA